MADKLTTEIGKYYDDPVGFVMFAFPWGQEGTVLASESGPDKWQLKLLGKIAERLKGDVPIQQAVSSGHGCGKGAMACWILIWFMSTRPHAKAVVTANTKEQLTSKTWAELSKWHKLAINKHWFDWTATKFANVAHPSTWFASAIPWSKEKSEAFAGLHEAHVLVVMDEASAIDDTIWEVTEGAMTTEGSGAMWIALGNPTRNTGRFKDCFGRFSHRWDTMKVDSREAKKANKLKLQQWVDDYGEDHDFIRVRVRGEFPRAGSSQLIPGDIVEKCMAYEAPLDAYEGFSVVLGVDVARFGDDQSVICVRQNRKVHEFLKYRGLNNMEVAAKVVQAFHKYQPSAIYVDEIGLGSGVADRLTQLGLGRFLIPVTAGRAAASPNAYFNKRTECWVRTRDFLLAGADLPDDPDLAKELTSIEYGYTSQNKMQIERKSDTKLKLGGESPDTADSLTLTFAEERLEAKELDEIEEGFMLMGGDDRNRITGY